MKVTFNATAKTITANEQRAAEAEAWDLIVRRTTGETIRRDLLDPVPPPPIEPVLASIAVTPATITTKAGETVPLAWQLWDEEGLPVASDNPTTFASANPAVATFDGTVVKALAEGSTTVSVRNGEIVTTVPVAVAAAYVPPVNENWEAEKPRAIVDAAYVPATGKRWDVRTTEEMNAAVSGYAGGDEIVVLAALFGNFVFTRPGRITVRGPTVPPAGKMVTPTSGAAFPKVKTTAAQPVFSARAGVSLRLLGLEIGAAQALTTVYTLVAFSEGDETSLDQLCVDCVVDRCLIVGHDALDCRRGVGLQGIRCAVVDSWIGNIKSANDASAVMGWNGPGPYSVYHSHLESSGEPFMFGGADPKIQNNIPSDILIDECEITKLLAWEGNPAAQLKNLGEAKNVRRLHVTRCKLSNSRTSTQPGYAIVLSATDQERKAPWSTVEDVIFSWCEFSNIVAGFNLTGWVYDNERFWTRRVSVRDSLIKPLTTGPGVFTILQRHLAAAEFVRTTVERCDYAFMFDGNAKLDGGLKGLRIMDNLVRCYTQLHVPDGIGALNQYAPGMINSGNQWVPYADILPATSTAGVNRQLLTSALARVGV